MGGGTSKKKMFRLGGREGVHQLRREGEGKKQSEGFGNGRKGHEKGGGVINGSIAFSCWFLTTHPFETERHSYS